MSTSLGNSIMFARHSKLEKTAMTGLCRMSGELRTNSNSCATATIMNPWKLITKFWPLILTEWLRVKSSRLLMPVAQSQENAPPGTVFRLLGNDIIWRVDKI